MRLCFVILAGTAIAFAQHDSSAHAGHVDARYQMTPMPPPKLMTGIGASALKITTNSAPAQAYFSQGMELLHCFWEFEAYRAFKEAARLDPDAPMAYWGILQAIEQFPAMEDERKDSLAKIKKLRDRASDHEKFYLREFAEEKSGSEKGASTLELLVEKYPDDLDAQAFLGLSLPRGYSYDGEPNAGQVEAEAILNNVLARHPDNAAANHYLIHVMESGPHAERALAAADVLAKLAANSGHMVHMPGHIYYRVGDYQRARSSFRAAMKVDETYLETEHVSVVDDWNYPHNISYLIAANVETGRYREALQLAAKLDALPVITGRAIANPRHAITVGATTARLQIRFGHWADVIAHPVQIGDQELAGAPARTYREALLVYARGMQAIEKQDFSAAQRDADTLDALQWRLKNGNFDMKENGSPESVLNLLASYSLDLRGNLDCASGRFEEGMKLLEQSAENARTRMPYSEPPTYGRPEQESIGYAFLKAGKFEQARAAFEKELKERPKSGHALYGIALSYERAGQAAEADKAFAAFLASWNEADADLPMMQHARGPRG